MYIAMCAQCGVVTARGTLTIRYARMHVHRAIVLKIKLAVRAASRVKPVSRTEQ